VATTKDVFSAGFAERLVHLRQVRGLTQADLSRATGISERMVAYYERHGARPPGAHLATLAKALRVSTDELLGLKPLKASVEEVRPRRTRLYRRLRMIEKLSRDDQRAVLKFIDALLESRGLGRSYRRRRSQPTGK
jgi:transcriptional regulator with XRE-family HTH domain